MKLPQFLYGKYADVTRNCSRKVTSLSRGSRWNDLVASGEWLDVESAPGLIVLEGPSPILNDGDHFHCFALVRAIFNAPRDVDRQIWPLHFDEALGTAWGILGFMGQDGQYLLEDASRRGRFLVEAIERWSELDSAVGARYSLGQDLEGRQLWDIFTNVKFALARAGVSTLRLNQPLPTGGIRQLINLSRN